MSIGQFKGINIITIVLCLISVLGIWYLYLRRKRNIQHRNTIQQLLPAIRLAVQRYVKLTDFTSYFSNFQYQHFLSEIIPLFKKVPGEYREIGLNDAEVATLQEMEDILKSFPAAREKYNNEFVSREIEKYGEFFSGLETYQLSREQMEAIVRDEDHNLVIAGAGTGKTTTISAKVAYLLEKGLAMPEELLIISFTNSAVDEMAKRCSKFCEKVFSKEELEVKTFNAFGYMVNRSCATTGIRLAFDGQAQQNIAFLNQSFKSLFLNDEDFMRKATNFIAFFNRPHRSEFSFSSRDEYLKYEKGFPNVALDGKHMKSGQEVQIANFLFLNSVDYEYERFFPLELNDRNPRYGDYCPDFYFPGHKIWLEHFGIDHEGNVPHYFTARPPFTSAKEYYHDGMRWKEEIHAKYQTRFIKSYSYEASQGKLLPNLRKKLLDLEVTFKERPKEEIFEVMEKSPEFSELMSLIYTFLGLMKSNNRNPADFTASRKKDVRLQVFLEVFTPLYTLYQQELNKRSALDFNDMVNQAADLIRAGSYTKRYKYILVDEFQDMSVGRYQLLKSLLQASPGSKLYAVGDDWQSVFRFTGTDISMMTAFAAQFGYAHQSKIARTYRFNREILEATSNFIQKNPAQIKKELHAELLPIAPSFEFISLDLNGTSRELQGMLKWNAIDRILFTLAQSVQTLKVFLIGRYHHNCPEDFRELQKRYPRIELAFHTAHAVKGLTCDYALLLDVDSGLFGFPSEVADDPILDYLLHEGDGYENAEERRLFYVALTRARHRVYFLYNLHSPSKFLLEFREDNAFVEKEQVKRCPECGGRMVARQGQFGSFYGCSNYPACKAIVNLNNYT